jgi:hypothetical protein
MDEHTYNQPNEDAYAADISDIAAMLDAAGAADRASPGSGFEARIAAATMPVAERATLRLVGESAASIPVQRSVSVFDRPVRMAAALAIGAGLLAVWVATLSRSGSIVGSGSTIAQVTPSTGTDANSESADLAFAMAGWGDDSTSSIDDLKTRADSVRSRINDSIDISEFLSEEGAS